MALRSSGSLSLKSAVVVGLLCLLVPVATWAHSSNTNKASAPSTCFPGFVCVFNQGGIATGGLVGLTMNGTNKSVDSSLVAIGTQSIQGTLSLTTGKYSLSSFGSGTCAAPPCTLGTFGVGNLTITVSNSTPWNGFSGTLFTGTFGGSSGISWIYDGKIKGKNLYQYELVGPISGTWGPSGGQVSGQTAQLFFTLSHPYKGGAINLSSGTTAIATPEPANIGLLGTGLILMGLLVRRRAKQQQSDENKD